MDMLNDRKDDIIYILTGGVKNPNAAVRYRLQTGGPSNYKKMLNGSNYTPHELFDLKGGIAEIYKVDSKIHGFLLHNGGNSQVKDIWSKLINSTFLDGLQSLRRQIIVEPFKSLTMRKDSSLFYSWTH